MANSVDPDQTAPSGAVWSGSTLFAYAILSDSLVSEILGHLLLCCFNFFSLFFLHFSSCNLKLLLYQTEKSGPLEFEIMRVHCMFVFSGNGTGTVWSSLSWSTKTKENFNRDFCNYPCSDFFHSYGELVVLIETTTMMENFIWHLQGTVGDNSHQTYRTSCYSF